MKHFFKILFIIFLFIILTILTQIGGVIYLLSFLSYKFIDQNFTNKFSSISLKIVSFLSLYLLFTFIIVPILAKPFGRIQLPLIEKNHLKPLTFFTPLLNRNYVKSELAQSIYEISIKMNKEYPGTTINYLDGSFPFIDNFPLLPHLSHDDGEKLDLSFFYLDSKTKKETNDSPSFIGYGVCEEPNSDEVKTFEFCESKGHWQYSILKKIVSQKNKDKFKFDSRRTKKLLNLLISDSKIGKIFIEPHLKLRLGFNSDKIRFQGCAAVRHDDHIHCQLK